MKRIAIIGTGIAGMGCAHFLHRRFDLALYEQSSSFGGHANTVFVPEGVREIAVDTGFMVYNEVTYPLLTRLFRELKVPTQPTSMSFSVRHDATGLEYCGSSLNQVFAQRGNLVNRRFWRFLRAVTRFNRDARRERDDPLLETSTVGEFVARNGYGEDFLNWYLLPMSAAVWSSRPERMLSFPAATLLRFLFNHGLLGINTHFEWRTVTGGSRAYVDLLTHPFRSNIRSGVRATAVFRSADEVRVRADDGTEESYDRVILACHADEALGLLVDPEPMERDLLGKFHYQNNVVTLHSDIRVLPRSRRAWASWNYQCPANSALPACTHYWMNHLQQIPSDTNYIVSLNSGAALDDSRVLRRIDYTHPQFDLSAIAAQKKLPLLNRAPETRTHFCGSYFRYGFHEDALLSAFELAGLLLGQDPWSMSATPTDST